MDEHGRWPGTRRLRVAVPSFLVVAYGSFLVLALVRGRWSVAVIMAVFLTIAVVMLRQRLRTGVPVPLLATVVGLLQRGRTRGGDAPRS